MGAFWRSLVGDSQLRWIGPEKGVIHLATAAVVNAVWDLAAKRAGKPLWQLVSDMTPAEQVGARRLPLHHRRPDARGRPRPARAAGPDPRRPPGRAPAGRLSRLHHLGRLAGLSRRQGPPPVPRGPRRRLDPVQDEGRRGRRPTTSGAARIIRDEIGPDRMLMVDANQRWDVGQAIDWMRELEPLDAYWIEEPTSPDDILGHAAIARAVAPIRVATGEHVHNRVMFKQLLQADAIGVCQIDACRLGGVNEVLAVLLHGGRGSACRSARTPAAWACASWCSTCRSSTTSASRGSLEGRMIEYVDHLHEHFLDPVVIRGRRVPWCRRRPGYSAQIRPRVARAVPLPRTARSGCRREALRAADPRPTGSDRRVRAPPRGAVAGRARADPTARTSATTRSSGTGPTCSRTSSTSATTSRPTWRRWPRTRRPSAGGR